MFITVHLVPDAAMALRGTSGATGGGLRSYLAHLGVDLEPLHPGSPDPDLAGQFYADVDDAMADAVCVRLLENPAVTAAYTKPAGGPPPAGAP